MDENFVSEFNDKLTSPDKFVRRSALLDLRKKLESKLISDEALLQFIDPIIKFLASEHGDSLRETASQILLIINSNAELDQEVFFKFLHMMVQCFEVESSEEIRLLLLKAFHSGLRRKQSQEDYLKCLDNITSVLKLALKDKYGEVIKEGSEAVVTLSEKNTYFHLQADFFVEPLLTNFKHLPMKVRINCVKALSPILIHAPLNIPNTLPVVERAWYESSPQLKLAIIQTIGNVSHKIEIVDQNYHYLLPVLLLGMCHDYEEVSTEAKKFWLELKGKQGFHDVFGVSLKRLTPKLLDDCENWNNDVRCQTAQLMYQFISEMPDRQVELPTLMQILVFQAGDEIAEIRQWACKAARLVGESVPKKALRWLAKRENPTHPDVVIYIQLVEGFLEHGNVRPKVVDLCLDLLVKFSVLEEPMLFDCARNILNKDVEIEDERVNQLLAVAFSLAEPEGRSATERRHDLLVKLASKLNFSDVISMIRTKLPIIWNYEEPEKWDATSLPWRIVAFVAGEMKVIDRFVFDLLRCVVEQTGSAEIKLKSFNMLTDGMASLECDAQIFQSLLLANLKWKAGRSASVLRSSVILCALTAIRSGKITIDNENGNVWSGVLHHLIEDDLTNTRVMTLKILTVCLNSCQLENMDAILTTMMGRLNDVSREVRQESIRSLKNIFIHSRKRGVILPQEQEFINFLRILSKDVDPATQTSAEDVLRSIGGSSSSEEIDLSGITLEDDGTSTTTT